MRHIHHHLLSLNQSPVMVVRLTTVDKSLSTRILRNLVPHIECDTILMDDLSKSDTIPFNEIHNSQVALEHEAKVSKISEEQLYYLMSRGLSEQEATEMIVMGFVEPFTKELPMEYAVELNRLISYEMEGSVG